MCTRQKRAFPPPLRGNITFPPRVFPTHFNGGNIIPGALYADTRAYRSSENYSSPTKGTRGPPLLPLSLLPLPPLPLLLPLLRWIFDEISRAPVPVVHNINYRPRRWRSRNEHNNICIRVFAMRLCTDYMIDKYSML